MATGEVGRPPFNPNGRGDLSPGSEAYASIEVLAPEFLRCAFRLLLEQLPAPASDAPLARVAIIGGRDWEERIDRWIEAGFGHRLQHAVAVLPHTGEAVMAAAGAGIRVFVSEEDDPMVLRDALHQAAYGMPFCGPAISRLIPEVASIRRVTAVETTLTPAEWRVAQLVARGYSNDQCGRALHLTEATVKSYLKQVFRKLGVHRRHELALYIERRERPRTPETPADR